MRILASVNTGAGTSAVFRWKLNRASWMERSPAPQSSIEKKFEGIMKIQERVRQGHPLACLKVIHTEARGGFGGSNASIYESSRPGYPAAAVRAIEDEILKGVQAFTDKEDDGKGGRNVVDLGCGTGKFTREVLPFTRSNHLPLIGIEPLASMRRQFEAILPGVRVVEGVGENIPLADESAAAVIAPQSYHWMSSAATLREVHRILRPGGLFVVLWNTRDVSKRWVRALDDIIDPFYGDDVPRQHGGAWRSSFQDVEREHPYARGSDIQRPRYFGELAERHFCYSQKHTVKELEDRLRSISVIATRPEPERLDATRRARELAETHPDTRDDAVKDGKVELFYDTEVYWCRKADGVNHQC